MAKAKRRARTGGWLQIAPLVPLALFASAFTVSATDDSAVATAALDQGISRNNPVVVPKQAITEPANIPVTGSIGNGIDRGLQPTQVVSGLSRNGIPEAALKAYSRAQQVMSHVDPGCQLPWTLIAAIGRVESNHGRHGGNLLNSSGVAVPGIYGPRLDGISTAKINDTDAGQFDEDSAFDRAVGPMQFIPGTWRAMGVDG
ncbi:MAG TPA: lytic murein transglycosylase, partial [Kribbella sp.]